MTPGGALSTGARRRASSARARVSIARREPGDDRVEDLDLLLGQALDIAEEQVGHVPERGLAPLGRARPDRVLEIAQEMADGVHGRLLP